jgi:hypothetical protein
VFMTLPSEKDAIVTVYTSFSNQKQGADAYDHRFDAIARLIRVFIPRFWRKIRQFLCATFHGKFMGQF